MMRWIWVLGKKNATIGGKTYPIADHWSEWTESIMSYPFRAPLLGRSESVDVTHDEDRAPIWGTVRDWRVLSRDSAKRLGIDQVDDEALYAMVNQHAGDDLVYVSPSLKFNYSDEDQIVWPAVIDHIAVTGRPYNRKNQPPQTDLVGVVMSRGFFMPKKKEAPKASVKKADPAKSVEMAEVDDDALQATADLAASVQESLAAITASINELTARVDAMVDEPASDAAGEVQQSDGDVADLRNQLQDVRAEMRAANVSDLAGALQMSEENVSAMMVQLSHDSWSSLVASAGRTPEPTERKSVGFATSGTTEAPTGLTMAARAHKIQKKHGVSFRDAVKMAEEGE